MKKIKLQALKPDGTIDNNSPIFEYVILNNMNSKTDFIPMNKIDFRTDFTPQL